MVKKILSWRTHFLATNWTKLPILGKIIPFSDSFDKFSDLLT